MSYPDSYDTEADSTALMSPPPAVAPPVAPLPAAPPSNFPPSTPWNVIEAASNQISAGQPVTALPKQSWSFPEQQSFNAKLDEYDRQAKAAASAAQQAAMDAQMFEQMSRVAKSTKDIEIAKRSIDVMGLQRDIQNGVPIHEAVARHPMALGTGFGSTLKATAPEPVPKVVNLPGMPPAIQTGNRVQFPPASSLEQPLDTEGKVMKDPESGKRIGAVYRTGPHTQHIVLDKPPVNATPQVANAIYNSQEKSLMKELETVQAFAALKDPNDPQYAYFKDLENQVKDIRQRRSELVNLKGTKATTAPKEEGATGPILQLPKTKAELVAGKMYETKNGVARWNGTAFEKVQTR